MSDMDPELRALLNAGFTAAELRALRDGLSFAITVAAGMEQDAKLNLEDLDVDWTSAKRDAWDAHVRGFLADLRARGGRKP